MVSEFWKTFLVWYETYTSTKLELLVVKILYGTIEDDHLSKFINHLLLLAKYFIYCCSIKVVPEANFVFFSVFFLLLKLA